MTSQTYHNALGIAILQVEKYHSTFLRFSANDLLFSERSANSAHDNLAEVMKKLAKDKMQKAISNVAYAKGDYEKEMEQAALNKEAMRKL